MKNGSMHVQPVVSVITCVRNGERTIARAIESLKLQSAIDWEFIVIDGMSTDSTKRIVEQYRDIVSEYIESPPDGISNAFNLGILRSRGRYIQLLNADDELGSNKLLNSVETIESAGAGFVFGDLVIKDSGNNSKYRIIGDRLYFKKVNYFTPRFNHPTYLVSAETYRRVGLFDETFKVGMDYEWTARATKLGIYGYYNSSIEVEMSDSGVSSDWKKALAEERRVVDIYGNFVGKCLNSWRYARTYMRRNVESNLGMRIPLIYRKGYRGK